MLQTNFYFAVAKRHILKQPGNKLFSPVHYGRSTFGYTVADSLFCVVPNCVSAIAFSEGRLGADQLTGEQDDAGVKIGSRHKFDGG